MEVEMSSRGAERIAEAASLFDPLAKPRNFSSSAVDKGNYMPTEVAGIPDFSPSLIFDPSIAADHSIQTRVSNNGHGSK